MKDKDLLKLLKQNGWEVKRINGSHHILKKDSETEIVAVHNQDVPTGLLNAILKRTGLK
ncbi:MAG: type II toxin-antitoxin system HicA family toxin [Hyphomonadaceae bacterium]|nr:type II toxin-antitoxin system HicA family toxin [Clostridia bacterium]